MPFYDEPLSIQDLTNIAPDDPQADPTLLQTFGAAFRTQNVVGSALASSGQPDPTIVEPDFNPIDYVKDDPKYAPYIEQFAGITNKRSAEAKKLQIDREEQDNRTLAAAGAAGVIAQMAAGVVDLPTLLPAAGGLIGGGTRAARIAGAALGAGLDAGVSEAALQATQVTRTREETALNIGGSIILGGALGTLVGRLGASETRALSTKIEGQDTAFAAADKEFANLGKSTSAGAAATDTGPLTLKDEGFISKLPVVNRQDPLIRLQLNELDAGRQAVRGLAETPLEYLDNAAGIATERGGAVETRMKMWHAPLATSLREIDTIYARYYHGTPEPTAFQRFLSPALSEFDRWRGSTDRLTYKQFKEQVGIAAYSGEQHAIPQVAEAARIYRRIDDAMKQAAIDAGIFSPDVAVKGDISHLFRMYNKEKIIARRDQFRRILSEHFQSAQQAAGFKADEIRLGNRINESDRALENHDRLSTRVQSLEDRLADRADSRQRRNDALTKLRQDRIDVLKERAPAQLVQMLRGVNDIEQPMLDAVKQSRAAARSANRKQSFAERTPVLAIIKAKGGVRVGSKLDHELRAMDVTPKTHPGMFVKKGGIGDVDNFVKAEDGIFADLPEDGAGYVDPISVMEAIRSELGGNPLRTAEEQAAAAAMDSIDRTATEWLNRIGLPENASVKDVRDFIVRVQRAEKDTAGLDSRISRFEQELEEFDAATEGIINEREISKTELKGASEHLQKLEDEIEKSADLAKSSPRIALIVDYAKVKRDLYKEKLSERTLSKRVEALQRMEDEGRANDAMLSELAAKSIDLGRVRSKIDTLKAKANKLEPMVLTKADLEKADQFANLLPGEVDNLADETINNILGHSDSRIPYDIVSGPRGALKERLLNIESGKIQDFLNTDIEEVLRSQVRTMSADVELARKFGSVDMAEQIRKINDEADAKIGAATSDKARQRIEASRKAAIRDLAGVRDRLRGQYALPSNPDSLVLRAGRIARNVNYLRLLGGMTVSAIPDMGKVVFAHGLTSTFRDGFIPLVKNFKAFRLAAQEVKDAGTALDMVLDSRAMAMADITDDFGRHSAFERGLSSLATRFGVVSLMAPWNATLKQFTGLVTMTNILRSAERIAAGKGTSRDIRNLASSGIDTDLAGRIAKQFATHGDNQDGILLAKAGDWSDQGAREAFRAAVVREVDRAIVTPGQDKPLWMSTELGKAVGQFKSFGISSMQKTMLAGLQQRDAATLNGVLLSLGLGAVTYWAKSATSGKETSDDPGQWAVEALDKSGLSGWLMDANNIAEKATRGRVGFSAVTGKQVSRFASRNVTGAFLGPSADAIADIFQVSGSIFAGDTTQSDLHKLRQLVPAQNLFYLRSLFDKVEKATGSALNLPETKKQ